MNGLSEAAYEMNVKRTETKLRIVAFHITRVCDNLCPFCYLGDVDRDTHPPFQQVAQIIHELAKQEVQEIYFVGGDPCRYPDILPTVQLSHKLGLRNIVLSNTLDFGSRLAEATKYVDCFEATILGPSSSAHDSIAGVKGAYENLVKNIKDINRQGKKVGIIFNATPMTYNKLFSSINKLRDGEVDIKYVMIQRVIPRGRAKGTLKYTLSIPQVRRLFEEIGRISEEFKLPILFEDPFPLCIIDKKYHKLLSRCEWGFFKGGIDEKGNVSRCGSDERFQLGNIFETPLKSLWRNSPILRSFRSYKWLLKQCQDCPLLEKCGGGCSLSCMTDKDHTIDILISGR